EDWVDANATRVPKSEGVATSVAEKTGLSNRTPTLRIRWGRRRIGMSGADLARHLVETEPRIATPGGRDRADESSISITPYQMASGEEAIVAEKIHAALSKAPKPTAPPAAAAAAADLSGQWDVETEYLAGAST